MLYGILIIILFIAIIARIGNGRNNKQLYCVAVLILIVYCGFRDPFIYPDIENYYNYFKGDSEDYDENFGLGYTILNHFSHVLSSSFFFFLMMVSAIVVLSYTTIIKKYSPYIWLSLILYIFINYYPSFFLLRQYLAMAAFLCSLKYVESRNPIKFGICIIIAISFHLTAAIGIPLYFLYGIKYSKKNMFFILFSSIAAIFLFVALKDIIALISAYYTHYFEMENESVAWQRAVMKVYLFALYLYVLKKNFYAPGINRMIFYCMILNIIICIGAINVYGVYRIREYFALADFIGVPVMLKNVCSHSKSKRAILYALVFVYIALLFISFNSFISSENMNNTYHFFWESSIYKR